MLTEDFAAEGFATGDNGRFCDMQWEILK